MDLENITLNFIHYAFSLMKSFMFTPLLLIGLLITSLSLILTLKNNNIYIKVLRIIQILNYL